MLTSSSGSSSSAGFLKIDVGELVPSIRAGMLLRTAWGMPPGLAGALEHPQLAIDLRCPAEKSASDLVADRTRVLGVPVDQGDVAAMLGEDPGRAEYGRIYRGIVDDCRPAVSAAVEMVARSLPTGVILGCAWGKDRTGVVVALVLAAIGVPATEVVAAERAARKRILGHAEHLIATEPSLSGHFGERVLHRLRIAHEAIGDCLEHCAAIHGSAARYLADAGVSSAGLAGLRELLV